MPMAAIKAFKEDKTFKNKIEFTAVGFGRPENLKKNSRLDAKRKSFQSTNS